jgi:sugar-phosphatase
VLLAAEDVAEGKPAPDGYLVAARLLGVDPAECVVAEDTPPGLQAGRASGAKVLALCTTFPASALSEADAVVASLAAVRIAREGGWMRLDLDTTVGEGVA